MKRLGTLLTTPDSAGLETLLHKAQNMDELAHKLRGSLTPSLAAELVAVNVRDSGELVVICNSGAWAARMRYETQRLVELARAQGREVSTCRVRVAQRTQGESQA